MATDQQLARIRSQLVNCAGWESDDIARDRKLALDYYYQRPRGDEIAGRSNVVSNDLSAMTEANLAQMLDSFTSANVVELDSLGEGDDEQAQLESTALIWFCMRSNNGRNALGCAVKDALLMRNGFTTAYVETTRVTRTLELENLTPEALADLMAEPSISIEILEYDADAETGRVRVTVESKRFRFHALAPENFLYPRDWHSDDLQEIPFCAIRHVEPRAELIRRGFPKGKVSRLAAIHGDTKLDSTIRNIGAIPSWHDAVDKSQDLIEWFECFVLMAGDDGRAERRRISIAGRSQQSELEDVPHGHVPVAQGSPFISPHRMTGISLYDKLRQTQDINTGLNRALLDNVNTVIKNRLFYLDGKVNVDDLSDGRPNGNVRVRASVGDIRSAVMFADATDLSAGILRNLDHQRAMRAEQGGASLELATGQMQLASERVGSEGVDRAFSVMEQLAAHMTDNLAHSLIRNSFLLAHHVLRESFDQPVEIRQGGKWITATPSEWRPRDALTVKVGMSPGQRARKSRALGEIVNTQLKLAELQLDDVLVNISGFYRALTDKARVDEIENPEQYYLDPESERSVKALEAKQKAQAEQRQLQTNLMRQAVGLEQLRTAFDKYKHDSDLVFRYFAEVLGAEVKEAEIAGDGIVELLKRAREVANVGVQTGKGNGKANGSAEGAAGSGAGADRS